VLLMSNLAMPAFHDTPVVRAVEQGYRLRLLTFGLGFIAAAAVLASEGASLVLPVLLAFNACLWPGLARAFALRSSEPHVIEVRNLLIDSALGGGWVALMQFNLLPCVLLTLVLTCDKAIAADWGLMLRGLVVQAAACVLMLALHGLTYTPQTSMLEILACVPLLVAYPLALALRLKGQVAPAETAPSAAPGEYASDSHIA
jgi:diguanylate cyclase